MADRLIRFTTALAVLAVAGLAAVTSYRHAYALVDALGQTGVTARLVPFTVDGLIWAASLVILDASRRKRSVPPLAKLAKLAEERRSGRDRAVSSPIGAASRRLLSTWTCDGVPERVRVGR